MKLQLKRLRREAGIKSQKEMADILGVPERRYASWEREEVMMNLEQAYNCAVALQCTIDEIAGMQPRPREYADKRQERMNSHYEEMNEVGQGKAAGSVEDIHANPANLKSMQQDPELRGSQEDVA